jgi:hypothetical protein
MLPVDFILFMVRGRAFYEFLLRQNKSNAKIHGECKKENGPGISGAVCASGACGLSE